MANHTEFQAVVLAAGRGSRMTELTAGEQKCLLPIGNKPMIWYPLQLLERCGFKEAIIAVPDSFKNYISSVLDKFGFKMKLDFVGIPELNDFGTADAIKVFRDKIHVDFIVISCDLITDVDIGGLLNHYRKHNASIAALMFPSPKVPDTLITPGPKSKQKPERDLIGIDNETGRLVFLASASDFEETVNISRRLLRKHTNFTMHSKLMDAHLYVIKKWVLDFLVFDNHFDTLKGEFLPFVVSKQLSKPPKQTVNDKTTSAEQVNLKEAFFSFAAEKPLDELIRKMSAFNDHSSDLEEAYHDDIIRCYAHIVDDKIGLRANTIQMYHLANAKISDWWNFGSSKNDQGSNISPTATVKSTQVQNCCIDENAFIDEKTSLRQSNIGPNTKIHTKTRISESIIMGNVIINERCVIHNCILCDGCVIKENTQLKDCVVGARHTIPSGSVHSRDVLIADDYLW